MALQKTMQTEIGLSAENAYHRVEHVSLPTKETIYFSVRSYVSVGNPFFNETTYSCAYDLSGENPIKQSYEHLKTLTEFADAADV